MSEKKTREIKNKKKIKTNQGKRREIQLCSTVYLIDLISCILF